MLRIDAGGRRGGRGAGGSARLLRASQAPCGAQEGALPVEYRLVPNNNALQDDGVREALLLPDPSVF